MSIENEVPPVSLPETAGPFSADGGGCAARGRITAPTTAGAVLLNRLVG
jgi:hypothetical protein